MYKHTLVQSIAGTQSNDAVIEEFLNSGERDKVETGAFAREVLKALGSNVQLHWRSTYTIWVTHTNFPYCIGWIGYLDTRRSGERGHKPKFTVQSWAVKNEKFRYDSVDHYTKSSGSIDTALKLAKTYLRRPSPRTVANIQVDELTWKTREEFDKVKRGYGEAKAKVVDVDPSPYARERDNMKRLFIELKHLMTIGHEFVDATFQQDLMAMFEADDRYASEDIKEKPFACVMAYESPRGGTSFEVVRGKLLDSWRHRWADDDRGYERYTEETLPNDLANKVNLLTMLNNKDFVDGVGYKGNDGVFYVLTEANTDDAN